MASPPPQPVSGAGAEQLAAVPPNRLLTATQLADWLDRQGLKVHITDALERECTFDRMSVPATDHKPAGVWYAIGGEWIRFCASDMPQWLTAAPRVYALSLDRAHLIELHDTETTQQFTAWYGAGAGDTATIDWPTVRESGGVKPSGVEIDPYDYTFRYEMWYYQWDIASGVIWDPAALVGVHALAHRRADGLYVMDPRIPDSTLPPSCPST